LTTDKQLQAGARLLSDVYVTIAIYTNAGPQKAAIHASVNIILIIIIIAVFIQYAITYVRLNFTGACMGSSEVVVQGVPKNPKTIEITNNNLIVRI
jgi:hypothetical protein